MWENKTLEEKLTYFVQIVILSSGKTSEYLIWPQRGAYIKYVTQSYGERCGSPSSVEVSLDRRTS